MRFVSVSGRLPGQEHPGRPAVGRDQGGAQTLGETRVDLAEDVVGPLLQRFTAGTRDPGAWGDRVQQRVPRAHRQQAGEPRVGVGLFAAVGAPLRRVFDTEPCGWSSRLCHPARVGAVRTARGAG